jgi:hypothetical protein
MSIPIANRSMSRQSRLKHRGLRLRAQTLAVISTPENVEPRALGIARTSAHRLVVGRTTPSHSTSREPVGRVARHRHHRYLVMARLSTTPSNLTPLQRLPSLSYLTPTPSLSLRFHLPALIPTRGLMLPLSALPPFRLSPLFSMRRHGLFTYATIPTENLYPL